MIVHTLFLQDDSDDEDRSPPRRKRRKGEAMEVEDEEEKQLSLVCHLVHATRNSQVLYTFISTYYLQKWLRVVIVMYV